MNGEKEWIFVPLKKTGKHWKKQKGYPVLIGISFHLSYLWAYDYFYGGFIP